MNKIETLEEARDEFFKELKGNACLNMKHEALKAIMSIEALIQSYKIQDGTQEMLDKIVNDVKENFNKENEEKLN